MASTRNRPHALAAIHRQQLQEWFVEGLTNRAIQARIDIWNERHVPQGQPPFPPINYSSISYHRHRMRNRVEKALSAEIAHEELMVRRSLRNRDERIKRLEIAAQLLEPYLNQINSKGRFAAAEQYTLIMEQIRRECIPGEAGAHALDPAALRSMPLETVKALVADYRRKTQQAS